MNLFLIGYRCTGKTSVGRQLARSMELAFVDTDARVQEQGGITIDQLVATSGWESFRAQETRVLRELCRKEDQVVSTGGGIILSRQNRESMRNAGMVVWLQASPQIIATRMAADPQSETQRPSLTGLSQLQEIDRTLAERLPLYEDAAHVAVSTDQTPIHAVCREIARLAGKYNDS